MSASPHTLSWFEIPVTNFTRAKAFYEAVLGRSIEPMTMGPITMGFLSTDPTAVSGAIVLGEGGTPSQLGTVVYFNGGDDLAPMLARVMKAGGSVVVPKTEIGNDFGYFAHFVDTEGNKVGLHSMA
jgi:predicted enzyme related to lactoylglutathione lyase